MNDSEPQSRDYSLHEKPSPFSPLTLKADKMLTGAAPIASRKLHAHMQLALQGNEFSQRVLRSDTFVIEPEQG